MKTLKFFAPLALLVAAALPAFPVSKEIVQLQTQVQALQDQMARMQQAFDERMGVMRNLIESSTDKMNQINSGLADLQRTLRQQQGEGGTRTDQLSGQIQALNDSVDELKARMGKIANQLDAMQNAQTTLPAGAATGQPAQQQAPPPDVLYNNGLRDYNAEVLTATLVTVGELDLVEERLQDLGLAPDRAQRVQRRSQAQLDLGDVDQAAQSWMESLSIFRVVNDWFGIIWSLVGLSLVGAARREDERTLRLAGAADRLSREYSLTIWSFRARQLEVARKEAQERLGPRGRGEAAWQEGQAMTTAAALEYALGGERPAVEGLADGGVLSRREREVVTMVASGMTNKEIARRLNIATYTVKSHVHNILEKLGVHSRLEAVAYANRHHLI